MTAWEAEDKARREEKNAETEAIRAEMEDIRARMDVNLKEMTARMMAWLTYTNDTREETMACQEKTRRRHILKEKKSRTQWTWNLRWHTKMSQWKTP
jgi:hypothetical protein